MGDIHYEPTQEWSGLDLGEIARHADADEEAFDRWLGSLSPDVFDRFLSDLHHAAAALFEQTA